MNPSALLKALGIHPGIAAGLGVAGAGLGGMQYFQPGEEEPSPEQIWGGLGSAAVGGAGLLSSGIDVAELLYRKKLLKAAQLMRAQRLKQAMLREMMG